MQELPEIQIGKIKEKRHMGFFHYIRRCKRCNGFYRTLKRKSKICPKCNIKTGENGHDYIN